MKRSQKRAFFHKFPFLRKIEAGLARKEGHDDECENIGCERVDHHFHPIYLRPGNVEKFRSKTIGLDFLEEAPWYYEEDAWERIYLVNRKGEILTEVKQGTDSHGDYEEAETIGEALRRLENGDDATLAVSIEPGQDDKYTVVFYAAPKRFSLKAWVEEQNRREEAREISFYASWPPIP